MHGAMRVPAVFARIPAGLGSTGAISLGAGQGTRCSPAEPGGRSSEAGARRPISFASRSAGRCSMRSPAAVGRANGGDEIQGVDAPCAQIAAERRSGDLVVVSIHWGDNWSPQVPDAHRWLARRLLDAGAADIVHGHCRVVGRLQGLHGFRYRCAHCGGARIRRWRSSGVSFLPICASRAGPALTGVKLTAQGRRRVGRIGSARLRWANERAEKGGPRR